MSTPTTPVRKNPFEAFVTPETVLTKLRTLDGGYYLGDKDLPSKGQFRIGGREGNILVIKNDDTVPTEMVLRGVFEIDRRSFYMTSDGGFDPENPFGTKLSECKATCRLVPVNRDMSFKFSVNHYPTVIENVRGFEDKAPADTKDTKISILQSLTGENQPILSIKLSHALFVRKTDEKDKGTGTSDQEDSNSSVTADDDYTIANWPVAERCQGPLEALASTHDIAPIPAFDVNHRLIAPNDYKSKLCGAIVEVHFALVHHRFQAQKKSTFSAQLREMIVLRPPVGEVQSPIKKRKLASGPSTEQGSPSKKARTTA